MDASETQHRTKKDVVNFLKSNFVGVLSTANDNKPTCSPVVYVIDDDLNFYFVTNTETYKARNIEKNPKVSIAVWQFLEMSVQMDGIATKVTDDETKEWVIEAFGDAATKDPNFWAPIFRIKRSDYVLFKIQPTWLQVLDLTHDSVRSQETPYTRII